MTFRPASMGLDHALVACEISQILLQCIIFTIVLILGAMNNMLHIVTDKQTLGPNCQTENGLLFGHACKNNRCILVKTCNIGMMPGKEG